MAVRVPADDLPVPAAECAAAVDVHVAVEVLLVVEHGGDVVLAVVAVVAVAAADVVEPIKREKKGSKVSFSS